MYSNRQRIRPNLAASGNTTMATVLSSRYGSRGGPRLIIGAGLLALGAALFGLGIFHGFENGSCSTTGYTVHYGQVPVCAKGIGWWMLILLTGLVVMVGGLLLSRTASALAVPVVFVAIGAPFVALALRSGNAHLLNGASVNTGKLYAGVFGASFAIAGLIWGAFAGYRVFSRMSGRSLLGGITASLVGLGLAFVLAAGAANAIGGTAPTGLSPGNSASSHNSGVAGPHHLTPKANAAMAQLRKAAKLQACLTAAGTNVSKIEKCEADYSG